MSTKKTLSAEEAKRIRKNAVEHGASEKIMMIANCVLDGDEEDAAILESYCIDDVVRDAEEAVMHIPFVELRGPLTDTERNWVVEHAEAIGNPEDIEAKILRLHELSEKMREAANVLK